MSGFPPWWYYAGPHDKISGQQLMANSIVLNVARSADRVDENARRALAKLTNRLPHGCQRWFEEASDRDIVEADHGHILWYSYISATHFSNCAGGQ